MLGFEDKIIRKAWLLPEWNSFLPLLWLSANKSQHTAVGSGRTVGQEGSRAHSAAVGCRDEPQRGRVELAQPHFPAVDPDPSVTSLVCCGSAYAGWWSYRIQSMWMLWFESLPLVFCQSSANIAVKSCLFSIQLQERLQIAFQCWIFLWSVRMCYVCQNYFIQVC